MNKLNLILSSISIFALLFLSYIISSGTLQLFILILALSFYKIRHFIFNKTSYTNYWYEITEFILNMYLLIVICRALFDPSINFNNYEIMMYNYIVIRIIYIIFILLFMNLLLIKSKNNKINKLSDNSYNYSLISLVIGTSILNLITKAIINYGNIYNIFILAINLIIIILCYKIITYFKDNNKDIVYLSVIIGILSILINNFIIILLPLSIIYNKYQKDVISKSTN